MAKAAQEVSIKDILRFPFQSPDWQKNFIIGSLMVFSNSLIPFVPLLFLGGYYLSIMKNTALGEELTLPAWEHWEAYFKDGLRGLIIYFVFFLPSMIVGLFGMLVYFAFIFILSAEGDGLYAPGIVIGVWVFMGIMFICMAISMLLGVLGAIPTPIATARMLKEDRLGAAFELRTLFYILRANGWGYLLAWIVSIGLLGAFYFFFMIVYSSMILCCLLPILSAPIIFYIGAVTSALYGSTYRESLAILNNQEQAA